MFLRGTQLCFDPFMKVEKGGVHRKRYDGRGMKQ